MSASHTPAPWRVSSHNDKLAVVSMETGARIGGMGWTKTDDISLADARLIAAAPDLLTALYELLDDIHDLTQFDSDLPGVKMALAAIAKTEGKFK